MSRSDWTILAIVLVVLLYLVRHHRSEGGDDTIEYRGEQFKMAKAYESYEDYKDDPNNLATNELSRIEKVMLGTSIGTNFGTREQLSHAVFGLKFPGYGFSGFGEKLQADGSTLLMFSVEVPHRDKDRYFLVRKTGDHFILVDDFVVSSVSNSISKVTLEGMRLLYYDGKGLRVREHQMTQ